MGKFAPRRLLLAAEAVAALTAATVRVRTVPFARWRAGLELEATSKNSGFPTGLEPDSRVLICRGI